jgi:hypothetical protein
MKTIYVAGPMRAPTNLEVQRNIKTLEDISFDVLEFGFCVICPPCMYRNFDKAIEDEIALRAGLTLLSKCDALFLRFDLPISEGVQGELDYCDLYAIPIYRQYEELLIYVKP